MLLLLILFVILNPIIHNGVMHKHALSRDVDALSESLLLVFHESSSLSLPKISQYSGEF